MGEIEDCRRVQRLLGTTKEMLPMCGGGRSNLDRPRSRTTSTVRPTMLHDLRLSRCCGSPRHPMGMTTAIELAQLPTTSAAWLMGRLDVQAVDPYLY